jgi:hypothetical protein
MGVLVLLLHERFTTAATVIETTQRRDVDRGRIREVYAPPAAAAATSRLAQRYFIFRPSPSSLSFAGGVHAQSAGYRAVGASRWRRRSMAGYSTWHPMRLGQNAHAHNQQLRIRIHDRSPPVRTLGEGDAADVARSLPRRERFSDSRGRVRRNGGPVRFIGHARNQPLRSSPAPSNAAARVIIAWGHEGAASPS